MLKKIKLDILSHIDNLDSHGLTDGEPEISNSSQNGSMKIFDGEITLSYKEGSESGTVFCSILVKDGEVTVRRDGAILSTLVFSEGKSYKTVYEVVPYKFDMTVTTKRIRNSLSESGGILDIFYEMEIGGAKKLIRMKISANEVSLK